MSIFGLQDSKSKVGKNKDLKLLSPPPPPPPLPPPPSYRKPNNSPTASTDIDIPSSSTTSPESSESEELQRLVHAPPFWRNKKRLSKQLSMCEARRDIAWEKRRRQILRQERRKNGVVLENLEDNVTDEDLHELKGCIELGFGFREEDDGQKLCNTLPALDLYFAVNRQLSPSPVSTPHSQTSTTTATSIGAPSPSLDSPRSEDSWKICSPGDNPEQVKVKLRHWAQAVACSVMQSF